MPERVKVDISILTIVKIIFVALFFVLLYWVRAVLLLIFISLILAAAFQPIIKSWSRRVGKTLAIALLLAIFFLLLAGFFYSVMPLLVEQVKQLIQEIPSLTDRFIAFRAQAPSMQRWIDSMSGTLSSSIGNVVDLTVSLIGGVASFITVIVMTAYFLADDKSFAKLSQNVISGDKVDGFLAIIQKVSVKLGNWLRGQLALCLIMGGLTYLSLLIIGVPYALTLGVITGVLEIVPIIGPIIACLIAAFLAYSVSPIMALIVVLFYLVLSQIENSFLVPQIMHRAIGVPPAIIIVGMLVFGNLLGIIGALLAVPILAILYVLFEEWPAIREFLSK